MQAARTDDRRHRRRPSRLTVTIHVPRAGAIRGQARNISRGGMFVETAGVTPPINAPVQLQFSGPRSAADRHHRPLAAVVAHCADGGIGLMFAQR